MSLNINRTRIALFMKPPTNRIMIQVFGISQNTRVMQGLRSTTQNTNQTPVSLCTLRNTKVMRAVDIKYINQSSDYCLLQTFASK